MRESTERPLKCLTPQLSERLRTFNAACRALQAKGFRLSNLDCLHNTVQVSPQSGQQLLSERQVAGYQRRASAGSTHYSAVFEGVTVEWRVPISYTDYNTPDNTFH